MRFLVRPWVALGICLIEMMGDAPGVVGDAVEPAGGLEDLQATIGRETTRSEGIENSWPERAPFRSYVGGFLRDTGKQRLQCGWVFIGRLRKGVV